MVTRIISAAVGIAIVIAALFLSATPVFELVIAALIIIMLYELLSACGCKEYKYHTTVCYCFGAVMPFLVEYADISWIYAASLLCTFLLFAGYIGLHKKITIEKVCCMVTFTLLVTLSMCCVVSLKKMDDVHGVCYVILCLAGAWLGDSGAFFVGTFLGKHKMCPEISPKKTWEGAVGGVVTVALVFVVYGFFYRMVMAHDGTDFEVNYIAMAIIGLICGVLGIIGDLSASLIKRQYGIKDYGNIMPGHGGMMDRFDSVLFVAPFMLLTLAHIPLFK